MSLSVIKAGFQDIVQDLGRVGYTHLGISPTGAADSMSLRMGNLLLGNDLNNAGLEITLFGGTYHFNKNTNAALCGSLFPSTIDGIKIPFFKTSRPETKDIIKLYNDKKIILILKYFN